MAYKGGDLNLRSAGATPSREAQASPERSFGETWGRPPVEPNAIAVDELVLACCNRAYDVAHFHGSADVRLDHLLHALTHVPAAAQVLTELGIRADILRRETAVAIAADTPAGPADRVNGPRASAALTDALRRAADPALARHLPASVHDLLRALLGGGPGSPAAHLLMRAAVDPQRLERWRDEPRREAFIPASPAGQPETRPRDLAPAAQDALLDRFAQMEISLRALREDMATDRRAVGDALRAVQAELQAFRADGARPPAADRSEAVDAVLEAKLGEFGRAMAALAGRLAAVDKLAASDNWQALGTRLEAVEGRIGAQTTELAGGSRIRTRRKTSSACSRGCARWRRSRRCAARISACRPAPRNVRSWITASALRRSCFSTTPRGRRSTRTTPSTSSSSPTAPICGSAWWSTTPWPSDAGGGSSGR